MQLIGREALIRDRLMTLKLASLLEVSANASPWLRETCAARGILYHHCAPTECGQVSGRFDLALVHDVELYAQIELRSAVGLLKNLLSERIWLLVAPTYCEKTHWIALGFKGDPLASGSVLPLASFSYNLETYNHKRDWNNSRFWANPEHWNKRF